MRPVHVKIRFGLIPFATLRRGELVTLRSGDTTRVLSTLTSPTPDFANQLVLALMSENDALTLERVLGQVEDMFRAQGRTGADDIHAAEDSDELDRRIDEELAKLDD